MRVYNVQRLTGAQCWRTRGSYIMLHRGCLRRRRGYITSVFANLHLKEYNIIVVKYNIHHMHGSCTNREEYILYICGFAFKRIESLNII